MKYHIVKVLFVFDFFSLFLFIFASHKDVVNGQTSNGRQPEGGNTQDNPSKPPAVRVVGGTPPMSLQQPWCLALIFAGLCLKWMLF